MTDDDKRLAALFAKAAPAAVGKIGGTEGHALASASSWYVRLFRRSRLRRRMHYLYERSGVFPCDEKTFFRFVDYYGKTVLPKTDLLCRWRGADDDWAKRRFGFTAEWLGPSALGRDMRWLDQLGDRRFVVVTSFVNTVRHQLPCLDQVWGRDSFSLNPQNVRLVSCPHYAHLETPVDPDWFAALDRLSDEMNRVDYDIALIGAGAWSLPLAVRAKEHGKIGVHVGGQLQRIFGIRGGRWNDGDPLVNDNWTHVLPADTPRSLATSSEDFRKDCAYW